MTLFMALVRERRRSLVWWAVGIAATSALIALSYATVADQPALNDSMSDIPDEVRVLLGIDDGPLSLTSPEGYLNSQLFANFLPLLLTVFGVSLGSRAIAGDEGAGRLELLLAHPVSRTRLAVERFAATLTLLVGLTVVAGLALVVVPVAELNVASGPLTAAFGSSALLGVFHAAVAFAVGTFSGRRGLAIAASAVVAIGGFLALSLAALIDGAGWVKWLSPWQWFADEPPILHGWSALYKPGLFVLAVSVVVVAVAIARFANRDLRYN